MYPSAAAISLVPLACSFHKMGTNIQLFVVVTFFITNIKYEGLFSLSRLYIHLHCIAFISSYTDSTLEINILHSDNLTEVRGTKVMHLKKITEIPGVI